MHPTTIFKVTILVILICHPSTVRGHVIDGITKAAGKAVHHAFSPIYKAILEGPTGLITRYFTLSDPWGIGHTVRKALGKTAAAAVSRVGEKVSNGAYNGAYWVYKAGSNTNKYLLKSGLKRLEEKVSAVHNWWLQQKLGAVSSVGSGIAWGIGQAISGNVVDKIYDEKDPDGTGSGSSGSGSSGSNFSGSSGSGSSGSSGSGSSSTGDKDTTTKATVTIGKPEHDPFGVRISDPTRVKLHDILESEGGSYDLAETSKYSTRDTSQVIIAAEPIKDDATGESDTSSTIALWKNPFKPLMDGISSLPWPIVVYGGSSSEDDDEPGCTDCGRKRREVNTLQGRRQARSVIDVDGADPLVNVFERVTRDDPQQCLPMVLCAIHADPEELLTPQETSLVTVFRPLVRHRHVPEWAGSWVRGARQGAAARGKAEEAHTTCRRTFSKCPFSAHHLRTLMASTFGVVEKQNTDFRKDSNLQLNIVES
ncbi:unnamed protein product [Meganyctiphanes norvegica]|uniref:Uncharacterized protein n=1 Tax=Meganyctiphanes norvegica TaxID=48144 RepID=A0AAV2RNN8_MEGNR